MTTAFCVTSVSLSGTWLLGQGGLSSYASASVFNDNEYVRRLNLMLERETRAQKSYAMLQARGSRLCAVLPISEAGDDHSQAQRTLVRLIARNSGLPEDPPEWKIRMQSAFLNISKSAPRGVQFRTTLIYLNRMESSLTRGYESLIAIAPRCDRKELSDLLSGAKRWSNAIHSFATF